MKTANKKILISIFVLGISFIITQSVIIRESISTFYGNETAIDSITVFEPDKAKSDLIYLPENLSNSRTLNNLQPPLDKADERVNKKEFGIYITPQDSPIQPERFKGFHTGVDFEVFSEELNTEVSVYAICSGKIKLKQYVSGYGGIAAQTCELNKEPITIIYGHLKLSSITVNIDENIETGERIGILGADKSQETDYERKHLHLGIYKGIELNIKGYVGSQSELLNWVDPCLHICHN